MEALTRRGFLATSGMSAGLGVLAAAAVTRNSVVQAARPGSTIIELQRNAHCRGRLHLVQQRHRRPWPWPGSRHDWLFRLSVVRRERPAVARSGTVGPREFRAGSSNGDHRLLQQ